MADDKIGSLSVDIEAPIGKVEQSAKDIEGILSSLAAKSYSIKIDDSRLSTLLDLVTKTKEELAGTGKQITAKEVSIKVKTTFDGAGLIEQIKSALKDQVFEIKVRGNVQGVTSDGSHTINVGASVGGAGTTSSSTGPGAELEKMFHNPKAKNLRDSVGRMYTAINEITGNLNGATKPAEQAAEMLSKFGDNWESFNKTIGSLPDFKTDPALKGFLQGFGKTMGLGGFQAFRADTASGSAQTIHQAARQTAAVVRDPAVRQAQQSEPVAGPLLAAARKRSDEEIRAAIRSAPKVTSLLEGLPGFTQKGSRLREPVAGSIRTGSGRARGPFLPGDQPPTADVTRVERGRGIDGPRPGDDSEADIIANRQIGDTDRANVRRLRRTTTPTNFAGGIGGKVDLEPLLQLAERGHFQHLVEVASGKKKGELHRLEATGSTTGELLESEASLGALARRRKGFTLPNLNLGQVKAVNPSEAFARAVMEHTGADRGSVDELLADPEVANRVGQAIRAGQRNKPTFGSQKRGQFYAPEAGANEIFQGQGGRSSIAKSARDLLAGGVTAIEPEEARALNEAAIRTGGENQIRIKGQVGLSEREKTDNFLKNPVILGQRQKELIGSGQLPDPNEVMAEFVARMNDPEAFQKAGLAPGAKGFAGGTGKGGTRGSAMFQIFKDLEKELSAGFPEDPDDKALGKTLMADIRSGLFGENRTRAGFAEEDIASREKPIRGGLRKPKSNASAGAIALDRLSTNRERDKVRHENAIRQGQRPATDLDVERQGIEGKIVQVSGNIPEKIDRLQNARLAAVLDPAKIADINKDLRFQEGKLYTATKPLKDRLAEISKIQKAAQRQAMMLGKSAPGDINAQRAAAYVTTNSGDESVELRQLLEAREGSRGFQASGLPTALGNQPPKQLSGDETRKIYGRLGITIGDKNVAPFASFNAGQAGQGAASAGAPGSGGTGPWSVTIEGQPIKVEIVGGGGSSGGPPRGRTAGSAGTPDEGDEGVVQSGAVVASAVATKNQMGVLKILRDPRTAAAAEKMSIRKLPTAVTTPEQRAAEKAAAAAGQIAIAPNIRSVGGPQYAAAVAAQRASARAGSSRVPGSTYAQIEAGKTARILSPVDDETLRGGVIANQAQQKLQSRSLGTSLVSLSENLFGGRQGPLLKVAQLRDAGRRQAGLQNQFERQNQDLDIAQAGRISTANELTTNARQGLPVDPDLLARHKTYRQQVIDITGALGNTRKALGVVNTEFAALEKGAVGASDVLRNLGAGFVGGIAGGLVTGLVSTASQAITSGISAVAGPALERATGFQNVAGQQTGAIAATIRQRGGDVSGATAGALAATGLSAAGAAQISPAIAQRAAVEAGNTALGAQIDLMHTQEAINAQNKGITGGVDKGIVATTGGVFGSLFGGIGSTQEQLKNELVSAPNAAGAAALNAQADSVEKGLNASGDNTYGAKQMRTLVAATREQAKSLELGTDRLTFFNDAAAKGGSNLKLLSVAAGQATEDQVKQSVALAHSAGLFDLEAKLKETHTAIGGATSGNDVLGFLSAINRGAQTPDVSLLLQDQARSIKAQKAVENAQLQAQLGQIPQRFGIQQVENPIGDQNRGLVALGRKPDAQITALQSQVAEQGVGGALGAIGQVSNTLGPEAAGNFATALGKAAGYGKQISDLQIGVEVEQAHLAADQFASSLIVANRSLSDAKGLAGDITDETKNLGALQRDQFMSQRQGEALSLGMSQRQINFQKALASFQAPGETSAERSARIAEAKLEADYAQKQLDIKKHLFTLGGVEFKITTGRGLQDAARNVALLKEGFAVQVDTAAASKKITLLSILQDKENKKVEAYYNAAVNRTNDIISLEGQLVAQTGKDLNQVAQDVINAYATVYNGITSAIGGNGGSGSTQPGDNGFGGANSEGIPRASGYMGMTNGTINLGDVGIAGEAGGEAILVLAHPRKASGAQGAGGGGVAVSIIFQGPVYVRSDEDIKAIGAQVSLEMNRHLANIGARIAA